LKPIGLAAIKGKVTYEGPLPQRSDIQIPSNNKHKDFCLRGPQLLGDKRDMIREMAAKFLGELGSHAKPAIPALRRAVVDESCYVRMYAERALQAIDTLPPHASAT
jgi:hypothetical protein